MKISPAVLTGGRRSIANMQAKSFSLGRWLLLLLFVVGSLVGTVRGDDDLSPKIVISEIMLNPKTTSSSSTTASGTTVTGQWVELHNIGPMAASMEGWSLLAFQAGGGADFVLSTYTFPSNGVAKIDSGGYLVVPFNAVAGWDVNPAFPSDGSADDFSFHYLQIVATGAAPDQGQGDFVTWNTAEGNPPDVRLPFDAGSSSASFGASLMRKDPSAMTQDATNWMPSTSPIDCNTPSGDKGTPGKTNSFTCPPPPPVLELTGLDLFHAESNRKILTLTNGTVVRLDTLRPRPSRTNVALNVVATYDATKYHSNIESVVFRLDNRPYRTEHKAPFCLCGNDKSDIFSCGGVLRCDTTYSVTAIPYAGLDGTGTAGAPFTVSFSIDCRKSRRN